VLPGDTPRLRFREMTHDDLDAVAALLGDPQVMEFYRSAKTRDEAAAWIEWNRASYAEHGFGLWVVETLAGEFVGDCGLTWQAVNDVRTLEVGYHVGTAWQGRGLATEAAAACRDLARERIAVGELVAITHPDNRASQRVAEKIGMHRVDDDHGGASVRSVHSMRL
jgi:RimJ/RimL family protein N-acetyltransferase